MSACPGDRGQGSRAVAVSPALCGEPPGIVKAFLYTSDDGGNSWATMVLPSPPPEPGEWVRLYRDYGLTFLSEDTGWTFMTRNFVGDGDQPADSTEIYTTDDGGKSWAHLGRALWSLSSPSPSLRFVGPQVGWSLVEFGNLDYALFRTTDGGATWERLAPFVGRAFAPIGGYGVACEGAPPSRVSPGSTARVTYTDGTALALRGTPGLSSGTRKYLREGTSMAILDGPECADGYTWWRVETKDGLVGWVAEGDVGDYYIEPWAAPARPELPLP